MADGRSQYLEGIDTQVAARSLFLHPFYQAWTRGELSREALRDYATQYYHHVAAFPTYLSGLHSHTADPVARRHILRNLMDEEASEPNHPELWLRFAEGLGLTRQDVQSAHLWDETQGLVRWFRSACLHRSPAEGLAALYADESQIPAVAKTKIEGLRKYYKVDDPKTLAYFRVHIEADQEHAAVERGLLLSSVTEENSAAVSETVARTLDALYSMLDGVCRRHGMVC